MRILADTLAVTRSWLVGRTAVTDIVGQRIYVGRLPAGPQFPAVRLSRIGSTVVDHVALDGVRVQVDCWGPDLHDEQQAWLLAATVHSELIRMRDHKDLGAFVTDVRTITGPQPIPDTTFDRSRYVFDVRVWTLPTA